MRISIYGNSGSGKSTLARRLATELDLINVELDAINWLPGWVDLVHTDRPEFQRRVQAALAGDRWVSDGNYSAVRPWICDRATDAIWLDFSQTLTFWRVVRRSFSRTLSRQEHWPGTGNRETFSRWADPMHPIRLVWQHYHRKRGQIAEIFANPANGHLRFHHLRHPREVETLITQLRQISLARP